LIIELEGMDNDIFIHQSGVNGVTLFREGKKLNRHKDPLRSKRTVSFKTV
jgi:hypothetical protein